MDRGGERLLAHDLIRADQLAGLNFHIDLPLQQVIRRLGIVSLSEKDKARLALKAPTTAPRVVRHSANHLRRVATFIAFILNVGIYLTSRLLGTAIGICGVTIPH